MTSRRYTTEGKGTAKFCAEDCTSGQHNPLSSYTGLKGGRKSPYRARVSHLW